MLIFAFLLLHSLSYQIEKSITPTDVQPDRASLSARVMLLKPMVEETQNSAAPELSFKDLQEAANLRAKEYRSYVWSSESFSGLNFEKQCSYRIDEMLSSFAVSLTKAAVSKIFSENQLGKPFFSEFNQKTIFNIGGVIGKEVPYSPNQRSGYILRTTEFFETLSHETIRKFNLDVEVQDYIKALSKKGIDKKKHSLVVVGSAPTIIEHPLYPDVYFQLKDIGFSIILKPNNRFLVTRRFIAHELDTDSKPETEYSSRTLVVIPHELIGELRLAAMRGETWPIETETIIYEGDKAP